ncbi:hypothetical protein TSMEX_011034 [Taenia solium]|eukprot:TsM_000307700 transcript=TsM_000307700 gene=TsM_000307700
MVSAAHMRAWPTIRTSGCKDESIWKGGLCHTPNVHF